jgi:hypothetical protein
MPRKNLEPCSMAEPLPIQRPPPAALRIRPSPSANVLQRAAGRRCWSRIHLRHLRLARLAAPPTRLRGPNRASGALVASRLNCIQGIHDGKHSLTCCRHVAL